MTQVGINWDTLTYRPGDTLKASIFLSDPQGLPPRSLSWVLRHNNNTIVATGGGTVVRYENAQHGVYRLTVTAADSAGQGSAAESAVVVSGGEESRVAVVPLGVGSTSMYLGALFSTEQRTGAGSSPVLPFQISSSTEDIYLLPGTTHFSLDLDPNQGAVDDEVVVRTRLGNWALVGFPAGLNGEDIGYDYTTDHPLIPAPADLKLRVAVDAFKVHGSSFASSNFRVRVKCWCATGAQIWQYDQCAYSMHPGGEGLRQRKFAALFTGVELETDVDARQDRLFASGQVLYTTPDVTTIPAGALAPTGAPNPSDSATGMFFTDSNAYATYESEDHLEIEAKAVAAIEGVRPFYVSFQMPGYPLIVQRVKRLYGNLVVYANGGPLDVNAVVTMDISTGTGDKRYTFRVAARAVYSPDPDLFVRCGSVPIDLSDFQFGSTGITVAFAVNYSYSPAFYPAISGTGTLPPEWGPDSIYASTYGRSVKYDGACYSNPQSVSLIEAEAVVPVVTSNGCASTDCGPVGIYCYDAVEAPVEKVTVPQPYQQPAPYIAFGSNPARCFYNPVLTTEYGGTEYDALDIRSYTDSSLCGKWGRYRRCGSPTTILTVVYPTVASPHSFISYDSKCYQYNGTTILSTGSTTFVSVGSVSPVASCSDALCNGSNAAGESYLYRDAETGQQVSVRFPHLDVGVPHFAVSPSVVDSGVSGLSEGNSRILFRQAGRKRISTVSGAGDLQLAFASAAVAKSVLVYRGGALVASYPLSVSESKLTIPVLSGDDLWLDVSSGGRVPAKMVGASVVASWAPVVRLPRVYDTGTVSSSGSVKAVGFCGLTDHQSYVFFGTLPAENMTGDVVNPDTLVTVQGSGSPEYWLVRSRAIGDLTPSAPTGVFPYAGETLNSPMVFKFYAVREVQGAHGEFDVWLGANGTFPAHLKLDDFRVISASGTSYQRDAQIGDTSRNNVVVTGSPTGIRLPRMFVADDGQLISSDADGVTEAAVYIGNKLFTSTGQVDTGLSSQIYRDLVSYPPVVYEGAVAQAGNPGPLTICTSTNEIYASDNFVNRVLVSDATTRVPIANIATSGPVHKIDYCPTTDRVFVVDDTPLGGTYYVINPHTHAVESTHTVSPAVTLVDVRYCPDDGFMYLIGYGVPTNSDNTFFRVDPVSYVYTSYASPTTGTENALLYVPDTREMWGVSHGWCLNIDDFSFRQYSNFGAFDAAYGDHKVYLKFYTQTSVFDPVRDTTLSAVSLTYSTGGAAFHPIRKRFYTTVLDAFGSLDTWYTTITPYGAADNSIPGYPGSQNWFVYNAVTKKVIGGMGPLGYPSILVSLT